MYCSNSDFKEREFKNWCEWFVFLEDNAVPFKYAFYEEYYKAFPNPFIKFFSDVYERVNWFADWLTKAYGEKCSVLVCDAIALGYIDVINFDSTVYRAVPYKRSTANFDLLGTYKRICPDYSKTSESSMLYSVVLYNLDNPKLIMDSFTYLNKFNRNFENIFLSVDDFNDSKRLFVVLLTDVVQRFGARCFSTVFDLVDGMSLFSNDFVMSLSDCELFSIKHEDSTIVVSYRVAFGVHEYIFKFSVSLISSFDFLGRSFEVRKGIFTDLTVSYVSNDYKLVDEHQRKS